ncbi:MAG: hypothetical protein PF448_11600 [Bacteroidales bacterium]|jgi:hypothetical protein|nr:hypothetical protein [Bacteroidales bacterium]
MRKIVLVLAICSIIYSCQKDENVNEEINDSLEYFPLSVGNYWIYQGVMIDTNLVEESLLSTDSVFISKDTIINNLKYFKIEYNGDFSSSIISPGYYRDSIGYLVNHEGKIFFSQTNFTDILLENVVLNDLDTIFTITCKMERENEIITVPSGSFEVLNFKKTVNLNPKYGNSWSPRYFNKHFSKNTGIITNEYSYSRSYSTIRKQLVRYSLND